METEVFLSNLVKNGNDYEAYKASDLKLTIRIYKNGFLILFFEDKKDEDKNEFFSFESEKNKLLFKNIKENKLPKEIIPKVLSYEKVKKLCLVVEDYSREEYFKIDKSLPTTKIVIKLLNGKTIQSEFNLSQTVENIKESISNETLLPKDQYTFAYGFPPKEIETSKFKSTIKDLQLENATLIQKIISLYK